MSLGDPSENLRQRTFAGLGWNGLAQVVFQVLQFAISVVLARFLGPREFGLMGMISAFTGFASIFYDMGLGAAIIQRKDLSSRHINTAFWINAAGGVCLAVLLVAAAPFIAAFYAQPRLTILTIAVSIAFIPAALSVTQFALISRMLDFRAAFWIQTVPMFVSGVVAVLMVVKGAGVWSLVAQTVVLAAVRFLMVWHMSEWRPVWTFDLEAFKELFKFSRNLLGNSAISYWGRNADRLMVGRMLGTVGVGLYGLAFRAITLPLDLTTNATNTVMFPALSAIQGDKEKLRRAYFRATRTVALVCFPIMIGLAALAGPLVLFVYGAQWAPSIPLIQILAFSGMAQSVYNTAPWIFLSQGRTDTIIRLGVWATLVRIAGVVIAIPWGILGVTWAYLIGTYVFIWYPTWRSAAAQLNVRPGPLVLNLTGVFGAALVMGAVVWGFDAWILARFPPLFRLAAGIPLGLVVYGTLIQTFRIEAWLEFQSILVELGGGRFPFLQSVLRKQA